MIFTVAANGWAEVGGTWVRCALGRGGVVPAAAKRESDGATPAGIWPLRHVLYRADRVAWPGGGLAANRIDPAHGWCDDPADGAYNRPVALPYPGRCETLWRDDALYDFVVVLGYNDAPVVPGAGSAIFLHQATPDFAFTHGCVALAPHDLVRLIAQARAGDALHVLEPE